MEHLPENFGYVVLSGSFMGLSLLITSMAAGGKRKALGVKFPNQYASDVTAEKDEKAMKFNYAQRGAMNPHESYPASLFGLVFGGLAFPLVASGAGFAFGLGALAYYYGYQQHPDKRYSYGGGLLRLGSFTLAVLPFITAFKMLSN